MRRVLSAIALCVLATPACALKAQVAEGPVPGGYTPEMGFLRADTEVVVLNKGGKYVFSKFTHIAQGSTCKVYGGQLVWKYGDQSEASEGETIVRVATVAWKGSDCPLGTRFTIPTTDYDAARAAYAEWTNRK